MSIQVFQVRKKDSGQIYAMKVMRKERILAKDHGDYVRTEREVLTAVFHPYIVTLRCSFQVCPPAHNSCILLLYLWEFAHSSVCGCCSADRHRHAPTGVDLVMWCCADGDQAVLGAGLCEWRPPVLPAVPAGHL